MNLKMKENFLIVLLIKKKKLLILVIQIVSYLYLVIQKMKEIKEKIEITIRN